MTEASPELLKSPNDFAKRVLLCSVGRYPQVVTETLYALVTEKGFIPTDIHVIGTEDARDGILKKLLHPETGVFYALCKSLGIQEKIHFDEDCIHVISNKDGRMLTDIRTPEDSIATADAIVDFVRKECEDESSALHVSISGGRKSLSFYLGYILSFFAQPQDSLSHVLVPAEYEFNPDFFYPTQEQQELKAWNSETGAEQVIYAKDASITLANIPIIRLRKNLPENFLREGPYSELIDYLDSALDPIEMRFDLEKKLVICDAKSIVSSNESVRLSPIQLTTMLWLALRKKKGMPPVNPNDEELALEYFAFSNAIEDDVPGARGFRPDKEIDYKSALFTFKAKFTEAVSRANGAIRKVLPEIERYSRFQVGSQKQKENGRTLYYSLYQLATPAENIVLPSPVLGIKLRKYVFTPQK